MRAACFGSYSVSAVLVTCLAPSYTTASGAMSLGDPGWQSWVLDEEKVCSSEI